MSIYIHSIPFYVSSSPRTMTKPKKGYIDKDEKINWAFNPVQDYEVLVDVVVYVLCPRKKIVVVVPWLKGHGG